MSAGPLPPCGWRAGQGFYSCPPPDDSSPPPYPGGPPMPMYGAFPPIPAPAPAANGCPPMYLPCGIQCSPMFCNMSFVPTSQPCFGGSAVCSNPPTPPPNCCSSPPPAATPAATPAAPPAAPPTAPPAAPPAAKPAAPSAKAPDVHAGAVYLYHPSNVYLKVPNEAKKLWEHAGGQFGFKVYKIGTNTTVKQLIERLGGGEKDAVTECNENGNGKWTKGVTASWKKAGDKTLEALGWTEKRDEVNPVWVCLHPRK